MVLFVDLYLEYFILYVLGLYLGRSAIYQYLSLRFSKVLKRLKYNPATLPQ